MAGEDDGGPRQLVELVLNRQVAIAEIDRDEIVPAKKIQKHL